ncbi:MAG TPA: ATP-dependent DNA helicase, partial [Candidatus Limnocylindria bacterium]|nr:ATP-dependent DNA helicase [Candidatus Limnocylindria bacterium]
TVQTFHAFGDAVLREHAFELGLAGDLRLLSRAEAILLLREELFSLGLERYRPLADPTRFLGALVDFFQRAKDEGITAEHLDQHARSLMERATGLDGEEAAALRDLAQSRAELAGAYGRYGALLADRGLIDHSDQVLLCLRLLRERPQVRHALSQRFRYLLVDEFQDTNPAQLQLVLSLSGQAGNVSVVGDDDQAIYAFRGAATSNLRAFSEANPGLRRVVLRRNYRSLRPIIEASQRLIEHNAGTRLAAASEALLAQRRTRRPAAPRLVVHRTAAAEADSVAREIAARIDAGGSPRDIAVLVRTNADTEGFVRSLRALGVPARSSTPVALHERAEVRVLLAYLRVLADPSASVDLYALACARPYGLGGTDLTTILAYARRRHRSLWAVLLELQEQPHVLRLSNGTRKATQRLVEDVRAGLESAHDRSAGEVLYDYLRRSGRLTRLVRREQPGDEPGALTDIVRFFELVRSRSSLMAEDRVALLVPHLSNLLESADAADEEGPPDEESVAVLTVHRAKGLEFPVVYVCGLVDGRFPLRSRPPALALPAELRPTGALSDDDQLAEERRLLYVAMTRARDELILSYSTETTAGRSRRPSQFLLEALDGLPAQLPPEPDTLELLPPPPPAPGPSSPLAVERTSGELSLSFSQLEDYFSCPQRYRLRHVVGVPTPPHHALVYGNALHQAVAAFHLRQARGDVMSDEVLADVFARHWSAEGFVSREHEEARYRAGQAALRQFRAQQLTQPAPPPTAVEKPFAFKIGPDKLKGRMDRLDEADGRTVITDYKSSDVRDGAKADEKARESLQLQVYALAHQAQTGGLPSEVRLHFLDSGVVGKAVPEPARLERTVKRIRRAADDIRAESFAAQPSAVTCGYCPYRAICPQTAA